MPQPAPADELPHPVDVGFLGAQAVVQVASALDHPSHQPHGPLRTAVHFPASVSTVYKNSITPPKPNHKRPYDAGPPLTRTQPGVMGQLNWTVTSRTRYAPPSLLWPRLS